MPLDKSGSRESVGKNFKTERKAGKSKAQSLAIALHVQDKANGKSQAPKQSPTRRGAGRGR